MKDSIGFLLMLVSFIALFLVIGFSFGYSRGMAKMSEIQDRVNCEVDYSYKPLSEVPVKCLKWFNLKENGK